MATELASAYVSLVPSFRGGAAAIAKELGGPAAQAAESAGDKASEGFASRFSGGLKSALKNLGALAGVAALGDTFLKAMDVEAATDKLTAQLGLTAAESERIGGVAGRLYANAYGGSIEEVNTAVGAVVSSIQGMRTASDNAVEGMTAKVLNFATAFEVDVARAAQVAGQLITTGLAKNGSEAMDLLTASMQRVPMAVRDDILDAADEYGPFMQQIGLTGQKAFGLLVQGAQKGMYGIDKTGDALKEFTIRATDMSTATKGAYDAIGLNAQKMTNDLLAGGERGSKAFDKIVNGLLGIQDPAKRANTAIALFGTPLEDLGVNDIPKFLQGLRGSEKALKKTEGAADRMGKTLKDNAKTNMTSFMRQAQSVFVKILGEHVIPIVREVAGFLANALGPALDIVGSILKNVVGPILQKVTGFLKDHSEAVKFFAITLGTGLAALLAYRAVSSITSMIKAWTLATKGMTLAQRALNLVMRANPIGIVITIIGVLVGAIVALWNKSAAFRNFFIGAWNAIKNAVVNSIGWVWNKILKPVGSFLAGAFKRAVEVVKDIWDALKGAVNGVKNALSWVWENVMKPIGNFFRGAFKRATETVKGVWEGLKTAVEAVRDALETVIDQIEKAIRKFGEMSTAAKSATSDIPQGGAPSDFGAWIGGLVAGGRANGGPVRKGEIRPVGERGPELFIPNRDGTIIPNHELMAEPATVGGSRFGMGTTINVDKLEVKAYSDRFSLRQVQDELALHGVA